MSGSQVPIDEARAGIDEANERMGEKGLRVLAFAARFVGDDEHGAMAEDPMSLTHELASVDEDGLVRVWALDLDDLITIAKDRLTRTLTDAECRQYLLREALRKNGRLPRAAKPGDDPEPEA